MKKEWFVGIDVSKKWLDVAIVHDVDAFTCTYGMEHTGFYSDGLQHFLDKKGCKYTMLEPAVIKHYPIQPREKNDRLDAAKIADYLFRFKDTIKMGRVPDNTVLP